MPYINVPNQKEKSTCSRIIKGLVPWIRHSEAFDDSDHPRPGPNGYPIPDPNPKFLSIPEPDPIFFQNHRVFRVSGIPENFNFCINLMCRLFKFWPVSFKATYILGQYNKAHQVGAILHVFMPRDRSSSALHLTTTMFSTFYKKKKSHPLLSFSASYLKEGNLWHNHFKTTFDINNFRRTVWGLFNGLTVPPFLSCRQWFVNFSKENYSGDLILQT